LGDQLKFIFILRNPGKRAVSAYWHLYKRKIYGTLSWYENRSIQDVFPSSGTDLHEYLNLEKNRFEVGLKNKKIHLEDFHHQYDNPKWPFYYVENSMYRLFIERYLQLFDKNQMLFLTTEELRQNPNDTFAAIANFLNINESGFIDNGEQFNGSMIPKKGFFNDIVHFTHPYVTKLTRSSGEKLENMYREKYYIQPENSPEIIASVNRLFLTENLLLSKIIDKDLESIWSNENTNI
jgi:hypothetical protein